MIIGRDLLEQLPLDIKFSDKTLTWQEVSIPMKTTEELDKQNINEIVKQCYEPVHLGDITWRTMEILDAKYEKAESHYDDLSLLMLKKHLVSTLQWMATIKKKSRNSLHMR